jgi:2-methylisocitrate lyase-like PEP mutase family enzyme
MPSFETFANLHQNPKPLLPGNSWDVSSAQLLEVGGYEAIGISGQAVLNIQNGTIYSEN